MPRPGSTADGRRRRPLCRQPAYVDRMAWIDPEEAITERTIFYGEDMPHLALQEETH